MWSSITCCALFLILVTTRQLIEEEYLSAWNTYIKSSSFSLTPFSADLLHSPSCHKRPHSQSQRWGPSPLFSTIVSVGFARGVQRGGRVEDLLNKGLVPLNFPLDFIAISCPKMVIQGSQNCIKRYSFSPSPQNDFSLLGSVHQHMLAGPVPLPNRNCCHGGPEHVSPLPVAPKQSPNSLKRF